MRTLFFSADQCPISYNYLTYYNLNEQRQVNDTPTILLWKHNLDQALLRSGKGTASLCSAIAIPACLSSSRRLSSSQRANSAVARCANASSVSIRATFRACWLLFRQASSRFCRDVSVLSSNHSSGGGFKGSSRILYTTRSDRVLGRGLSRLYPVMGLGVGSTILGLSDGACSYVRPLTIHSTSVLGRGNLRIRSKYQGTQGSGPNLLLGETEMGVHLRTTSYKFSDATLGKVDKLHGRLSLICANRTQVVRLAIDVLDLVLFTVGSMDAVVRGIQGLCGITSFPLQSEFRFPAESAQGGAGSDCSGGDLAVRPRVVVSINHRRMSLPSVVWVDAGAKAWKSPRFPAMYRYPNTSTYGGVA